MFAKVKQLIEEIEAASPKTKDELEQFRIQYLGSKNVIKPLFGEIKNVPNEQKKEYGQFVNQGKEPAERKLAAWRRAPAPHGGTVRAWGSNNLGQLKKAW